MRALHGSCLLPSPVCICKGVEDGLCSAQQAGTLNLSKSPHNFSGRFPQAACNEEPCFEDTVTICRIIFPEYVGLFLLNKNKPHSRFLSHNNSFTDGIKALRAESVAHAGLQRRSFCQLLPMEEDASSPFEYIRTQSKEQDFFA